MHESDQIVPLINLGNVQEAMGSLHDASATYHQVLKLVPATPQRRLIWEDAQRMSHKVDAQLEIGITASVNAAYAQCGHPLANEEERKLLTAAAKAHMLRPDNDDDDDEENTYLHTVVLPTSLALAEIKMLSVTGSNGDDSTKMEIAVDQMLFVRTFLTNFQTMQDAFEILLKEKWAETQNERSFNDFALRSKPKKTGRKKGKGKKNRGGKGKGK
jgi:hypothetical protein